MNIREAIILVLASIATATVLVVVLLGDIWFQELPGRLVAITILSAVIGCVWVSGAVYGMGQCGEQR